MGNNYEPEKIEYLFVDIEWNQTPGTKDIEDREPIQIGIIGTDEFMNIKKSFFRAMRLSAEEKYNPDVLSLSHSSLKAVMQAKSEKVVLRKINSLFPQYRYVVVWTNDTYELLKREMDAYGYLMPKHRIIVFQEVLTQIATDGKNRIGFERALMRAGIEYQKKFLHYSQYDVEYMYRLFRKCYRECNKLIKQEACYLNTKTHILHTDGCPRIKGKYLLNIDKTTRTAIFQGNRVCKVCGSAATWNRLKWRSNSGEKQKDSASFLKELPLTDKNMRIICSKFGLVYSITPDMIFVRTSFCRWIIHIRNNRVIKLYHENYRPKRSEALKLHKKTMEGYHNQKLPSSSFYDVVKYIRDHDENMVKRLVDNKSYIDVILKRIEGQRKNNIT